VALNRKKDGDHFITSGEISNLDIFIRKKFFRKTKENLDEKNGVNHLSKVIFQYL
jgi:hypothetical protein